MCWEARNELKKHWTPKGGDLVLTKMYNYQDKIELKHLPDDITGKKGSLLLHKQTDVWLPRQEDLQEILIQKYKWSTYDLYIYFERFLDLYYEHFGREEVNKLDFNQLWLCFIMETIFSKTWNGQTWEVIK